MTTEGTSTPLKRSLLSAGDRRHKVHRSAGCSAGSPWRNLLQAAAAQDQAPGNTGRPPNPDRLPTGHQQNPNQHGSPGPLPDIASLRAGLSLPRSVSVPSPFTISPQPTAPEAPALTRRAGRQLSPVLPASPGAGLIDPVELRHSSFTASASHRQEQQTALSSLRSLPAGLIRTGAATRPLPCSDPLHSYASLPVGAAQPASLALKSLGSSSISTLTRSRAFAGRQSYASNTEAKSSVHAVKEPALSQPTTPRLGSSAFVTWPSGDDPAEDKDDHSGAAAAQSPATPREADLAKQLEDERVINTILMQEVTMRQMESEAGEQSGKPPGSQAADMQHLMRIQGASTALTAMQQVLQAKDEQIVELQAQVKQAVDAEKARWASTFTALVTSCKEPFRKLQTAVRAQETELRQLRSAMSARGSDELVSSGNSGSAHDSWARRYNAPQPDAGPAPPTLAPAAAAAKHAAEACFNPFAAHRMDAAEAARMLQAQMQDMPAIRQMQMVGSGSLHPPTPNARQAEERRRRDMQSWSLTAQHAGSLRRSQLFQGCEEPEAVEAEP